MNSSDSDEIFPPYNYPVLNKRWESGSALTPLQYLRALHL